MQVALFLGSIGVLCLVIPQKVLITVTKFNKFHIRIIGAILFFLIVIIMQSLSISSLVGIINTLGRSTS